MLWKRLDSSKGTKDCGHLSQLVGCFSNDLLVSCLPCYQLAQGLTCPVTLWTLFRRKNKTLTRFRPEWDLPLFTQTSQIMASFKCRVEGTLGHFSSCGPLSSDERSFLLERILGRILWPVRIGTKCPIMDVSTQREIHSTLSPLSLVAINEPGRLA